VNVEYLHGLGMNLLDMAVVPVVVVVVWCALLAWRWVR
jgi:hypothetical protein